MEYASFEYLGRNSKYGKSQIDAPQRQDFTYFQVPKKYENSEIVVTKIEDFEDDQLCKS